MDINEITDELTAALLMARDLSADSRGMVGYGVAYLVDSDDDVRLAVPFANLITDVGDLYYATKCIQGIGPSSTAAPSAQATGIKLGTGTSAATKNGAGAALGTYLSGSNTAFDATFPKVNNLGAGNGVQSQYQATVPVGSATNAAIAEAAIVTDTISTNSTSLAAATISRSLFSATINKPSDQALVVLWNHLNKGA